MDAASFDWDAFSGKKNSNPSSSSSKQHLNSHQVAAAFQSLSLSPHSASDLTESQSQLSYANKTARSVSLPSVDISNNEDVPLSLSIEQLGPEESKTYLRWFNDLSIRKHAKLIEISDVLDFFKNFNLSDNLKQYLKKLFPINVHLNIGQFCALLRLIGHYLVSNNKNFIPSRSLILKACPVPKPRSILAKKRVNDDDISISNDSLNSNTNAAAAFGTDSKIDLDSFAKFMLTGEKPSKSTNSPIKKKKKKKRVKFSDQLVTTVASSIETVEDHSPSPPVSNSIPVINVNNNNNNSYSPSSNLDLSLPMDQLLQKLKNNPSQKHQIAIRKISEEEVKDEEEILGQNFKHFQQVNIESALVHGKAAAIPQELVATNTGGQMEVDQTQMLQPTMTGSANYFIKNQQSYTNNGFQANLQPNSYNNTQHVTTNQNLSSQQNEVPNYFSNILSGQLSPPGISPQGLSPNNTNTGTSNQFGSNNNSSQFLPTNLQLPNNNNNNNYFMGRLRSNSQSISPQPTQSRSDQFINSLTNGSNNLVPPPPPPPRSRSNSLNTMLQPSNTGLQNTMLQPSNTGLQNTYQSQLSNDNSNAISAFPPPPPTVRNTGSFSLLTGGSSILSPNATGQQQQNMAPPLPPKISINNQDLNQQLLQNQQITSPYGQPNVNQFAQQTYTMPQQPYGFYGQQFNNGMSMPQYGIPQQQPQAQQPQQPPQDDLEWFER